MRIILGLVTWLVLSPSSIQGQRYLDDVFSDVSISQDILYGNATNDLGQSQDLLFDFYEPDGDNLDKRPLLIWIHGGSFVNGSKSDFSISTFSNYLVPKGYTTAQISYRLSSTEVLRPDASVDTLALYQAVHNAVHDARAAVRFFKKNAVQYRVDPDQIYVAGLSAGAITAIELAYIDRIEELYPNANPQSIEGDSGNSGFNSSVRGVVSLCGTSIVPEIIEGPFNPPLFMAHDQRDPIVPYSAARATFDRASAVGTPVVGNFYDTGFHCSWSIPLLGLVNLIDVQNQLRAFLFATLTIPTSSEEIASGIGLEIYPNPFTDYFKVDSNLDEIVELEVVNSLGQIVQKSSISRGTHTIFMGDDLSPGLYLLSIRGAREKVHSLVKIARK